MDTIDSFDAYDLNITAFTEDGKTGIMDSNDNIILPAEYAEIEIKGNYVTVKTIDEQWGAIKITTNQVVMAIDEVASNVFGKVIYNDVSPVIVNDRTMIPIRFIAEALGLNVSWNETAQTVSLKGDVIEIEMGIDSNYAKVNGTEKVLDVAPFIENNRTYLPVRFISENLGAKVEWVPGNRSIIVTK